MILDEFFGDPNIRMGKIISEMQPLWAFFKMALDLKDGCITKEIEDKMKARNKEKYIRFKQLDAEKTQLIVAYPFHFRALRESILNSPDS